MKTYFRELKHFKFHEEQEDINFEFPMVTAYGWKVEGFMKGDHVLLRGTNSKGKVYYKKYNYSLVYDKIRKDYNTWATDKFIIEDS